MDRRKFISYDYDNGVRYLKSAVMNALSVINNKEDSEIRFLKYMPKSLVLDCIKELNWKIGNSVSSPNGEVVTITSESGVVFDVVNPIGDSNSITLIVL
jgi:hypothetical protein